MFAIIMFGTRNYVRFAHLCRRFLNRLSLLHISSKKRAQFYSCFTYRMRKKCKLTVQSVWNLQAVQYSLLYNVFFCSNLRLLYH